MSAPRDFLFMGVQPESFGRERIYDGTDDLVARITAAVRVADQRFESSGGSSRHWVRECLLPTFEEASLVIGDLRQTQMTEQHRGSAEKDVATLANKLDASDRLAAELLAACEGIEAYFGATWEGAPDERAALRAAIARAKARGE